VAGSVFERRGRKDYAKGAEKKYQKNKKLNTKLDASVEKNNFKKSPNFFAFFFGFLFLFSLFSFLRSLRNLRALCVQKLFKNP
jgi:hypothetical protein